MLSGITISRCSKSHVLGLCLLNAAVFPPAGKVEGQPMAKWRMPGYILGNSRQLLKRMEYNHIMVATKGGLFNKVVGSVEIHTAEYLRAQGDKLTEEQASLLQPYLCSMAVREDVRGRGVGRALVEAAVEAAAATATPGQNLLLQVQANNTAAVALYEACGFTTISHPWCQMALMRRRLREPEPEVVREEGEAAEGGGRERVQTEAGTARARASPLYTGGTDDENPVDVEPIAYDTSSYDTSS